MRAGEEWSYILKAEDRALWGEVDRDEKKKKKGSREDVAISFWLRRWIGK